MQQEVDFSLEDLQNTTPTFPKAESQPLRETTISSCESNELQTFAQVKEMVIMMLNGVKTAEEGAQLKVTLAHLFMESIGPEERKAIFEGLKPKPLSASDRLATIQKQLEQCKKVKPVINEVQERKRNKKRAVKEGQKSGFWEQQEKERLVEGVKLFGTDWKKVTGHVGTRDRNQVIMHWHYSEKVAKNAKAAENAKTIGTASPKLSLSEN